ncbi:hypothetical protein HDU91_005357 [Kappamyces sp. JEL0680]|nr:hypothetical protein HDU91_005357 [Kappamyces sp. JEL0680]
MAHDCPHVKMEMTCFLKRVSALGMESAQKSSPDMVWSREVSLAGTEILAMGESPKAAVPGTMKRERSKRQPASAHDVWDRCQLMIPDSSVSTIASAVAEDSRGGLGAKMLQTKPSEAAKGAGEKTDKTMLQLYSMESEVSDVPMGVEEEVPIAKFTDLQLSEAKKQAELVAALFRATAPESARPLPHLGRRRSSVNPHNVWTQASMAPRSLSPDAEIADCRMVVQAEKPICDAKIVDDAQIFIERYK